PFGGDIDDAFGGTAAIESDGVDAFEHRDLVDFGGHNVSGVAREAIYQNQVTAHTPDVAVVPRNKGVQIFEAKGAVIFVEQLGNIHNRHIAYEVFFRYFPERYLHACSAVAANRVLLAGGRYSRELALIWFSVQFNGCCCPRVVGYRAA